MFKQKGVALIGAFAVFAGVLSSVAGCGGGSSSTGGLTITASQLYGSWQSSSLTAFGQTVACPGVIWATQNHSVECDDSVVTFSNNGTYAFTGSFQDQGTWTVNGNQLTISSGIGNGTQTLSITAVSASSFSTSITTQEDGTVVTNLARVSTSQAQDLIVFQSSRFGADEIFLMNANGSGLERLTNNTVYDGEPAISPDGSKIAFTSMEDGGGIFLMNPDGSDRQKLTSTRATYWMEWSRDGTKLAFMSDQDVYTILADGSNLTNLTNTPGLLETSPTWSQDGTKIAYGVDDYPIFRNIVVVNADGSGKQTILSEAKHPAWSPVGDVIAFNRDSEIYTCNADGSSVKKLTTGANAREKLSWSPDGQHIVFECQMSDPLGYEICKVPSVGGTVTNLTDSDGYDGHPTWGRQE